MKDWNTKRALSSLAAAAILTLAGGGAALAADTPPGFPKDNVTIEIWWHEYGPFTAYMKELIDAYKKERPNVTVNPVITSSGDINQKLTVALATGTGPDIMDQDASFYELYYKKGVLEPLNLDVFGVKSYQELAARYTPGGIAAGTFDGKVYALPYQGNSMSLFINNKAFAAAGLDPVKDAPKTWDDMKALGPKLKKVQVHMRDVATASWYIRSEFTNEIGQAVGRAIERTVYDGMDPKASLDQAQAEIEKVFKQ